MVQFLGKVTRAQAICQQMLAEDPDIINLQEVFADEAVEELTECLEDAGYFVINNQDAGLLTASKFPISSSYFEEYDSEHGVFGHGHDTWKKKGFLAAHVELEEGCLLTAINTHLDAGGDSESKCAKINQLIQMNNYLNTLDSDVPVFIGGDFNINAVDNNPMGWGFNDECFILLGSGEVSLGDIQNQSLFSLLNQVMDATPIHTLTGTTLGPTSLGGSSVLDYFLLANNSEFVTNLMIENLDVCENSNCWMVYADWDGIEFITCDEEEMLYNISIGYSAVPAAVGCVSDHSPVRTCFSYDCDGQPPAPPYTGGGNTNDDPPGPTNDCFPKCPPGEQCINGLCVPW